MFTNAGLYFFLSTYSISGIGVFPIASAGHKEALDACSKGPAPLLE